MQLSSNRVLFVSARVVEILIAGVFLVAAIMKALDPAAFVEQIVAYDILPGLAPVAAWSLIIVECVLAGALIVNLLPRILPFLTMGLLLFFIGITLYGMSIGLGDDCGCFGNLYHRGPEMVIIEDALMLVGLVFVVVVLWNRQTESNTVRYAVTAAVGLASAGVIAFSPFIPADNIVTQLHPGSSFTTWPVDGLYGKDLNSGTHVVFLFTVAAEDIGAQVGRMNAVAREIDGKSAIGLIIDGTEHLTTLMFEYAAAFPVAALEPRFARPLYRVLPRTFILHNGSVTHTWSELPSPASVVTALGSLPEAQEVL
jgi:uncharacterized membrane protein YphA (DoxX/SURF4 family)